MDRRVVSLEYPAGVLAFGESYVDFTHTDGMT